MSATLKEFVKGQIEWHAKAYASDLEAMTPEQLETGPGEGRKPYDFTYEIIKVNDRVIKRLKGEDPGEWPFQDGWAVAPAEVRRKDKIKSELEKSCQELIEAWDAFPAEKLEEKIDTGNGHTTALELGSLTFSHLNYHDAQLNYVQAVGGDMKVHWDTDA